MGYVIMESVNSHEYIYTYTYTCNLVYVTPCTHGSYIAVLGQLWHLFVTVFYNAFVSGLMLNA